LQELENTSFGMGVGRALEQAEEKKGKNVNEKIRGKNKGN
jgi:hypothetical protein